MARAKQERSVDTAPHLRRQWRSVTKETRVLIVDDDPTVRRVVREMLSRAGYVVDSVSSGTEALAEVRNQSYDLLVLDIVMPEKGGIETMMEMRRAHSTIPVIVITGRVNTGDDAFRGLVQQFGAKAILRKPFRKSELLETIESVVGGTSSILI